MLAATGLILFGASKAKSVICKKPPLNGELIFMKLFRTLVLSVLILTSTLAGANEFVPTSPLNNVANGHTATLLDDGDIIVIGIDVEIYDSDTRVWTVKTPMNLPRLGHSTTLLENNTIVVVGGSVNNDAVGNVEIYNIADDVWTNSNPIQLPRIEHRATLLDNGKILISGGGETSPSFKSLSSAELFDPVSEVWSSAGSMTDRRFRHQQVLLDNGEILAAGGRDFSSDRALPLSSADIYNPTTNSWRAAGPMLEAHSSGSMIKLTNGNVLMATGTRQRTVGNLFSTEDHPGAEIYNPLTNTWSATGGLNVVVK